MTTIYDIAGLAKVSPSTVSRVINRRGGVSRLTVDRIERVMREKNFQPHWKASPAKAVGILVFPHHNCLANPYSAHVLSAACEMLFAEGYVAQLIPHHHTEASMHDLHRLVTFHQIQGVLVMAFEQTYEAVQRIECSGIPHVVVEGPASTAAEHHVVAADFDAGRQAGRYLWQLGHRRFAVVTPSIQNVVHQQRMEGVLAAVEEAGGDPEAVTRLAFADLEAGESAAMTLMTRPDRPTAVVVTNGQLAIRFNRGCHKLGLAVPHDVSLLGFEDAEELASIDPPMTAMRMPARRMGEQAARVLMNQIVGAPLEPQIPFELTFLARQSTAPTNRA